MASESEYRIGGPQKASAKMKKENKIRFIKQFSQQQQRKQQYNYNQKKYAQNNTFGARLRFTIETGFRHSNNNNVYTPRL